MDAILRRLVPARPLPGLWRALALAAAYFAAGKLALWLAIAPGYATAVWPPAGIALAAVLLFGPAVAPGIWLGSFLTHLATSLASGDVTRPAMLAGAIAFGAMFEALMGAALIRRAIGTPGALVREREVFGFLFLGGPVASVVGASCGVATLTIAGVNTPDAAAFSWFTWWIGDTIGVLIFAPLVLMQFAAPREVWRARRLAVGVPLLISFALTVVIFFFASHWERERARADFERQAENLARRIDQNLATYVAVQQSVVGLYAGSRSVEREEFRTFVTGLLADHPGIQGLSWNARVPADRRGAFERAQRATGAEQFRITDESAQREIVPAAQRHEYMPVTYFEPLAGNERVIGFDSASQRERRIAQQQACDRGALAVTRRVRLVQTRDARASVILYLPVFDNERPRETIAQRRENLRGFVAVALRIDDVIATALQGADARGVALRLEDEAAPARDRLLWGAPAGGDPDGFAYEHALEIAGLQWTLRAERDSHYLVAHRSLDSWFVLLGGLLLDSLFGSFLLILTGRAARIESVVSERTHQLSDSVEALRLSENQFRSVTESANDAIIIADVSGRILRWNHAAERCFGYVEADAIGKPVSVLIPERLRGAYEAGIARLRSGGVPRLIDRTLEVRGLRHDGRELPLEISLSTWCSEDGTFYCGILRDIRERHRAEHELQRAKEAAEAGNRAKGDFLANMSHEIRTPMNAVIGMTALLLDTPLEERQREFVETIRFSGEHLLTVINEILDLSKIEAGHLELEESVFDVRGCVEEAIGLIAPRATEKGLAVGHRCADSVPVAIASDAGRLRQVLVNLVGNAVKFTERGGVEVEVEARTVESLENAPARVELHFSVRDTGFGIPEDQVDRLFEPFTQADASVTRRFGGTGLGLTISKRLCEGLGGKIWVESAVGRGSTFHFTIAASAARPEEVAVLPPVPGNHRTAAATSPPKLRILLAEDNQVNQKVARLLLERLGYTSVDAVGNGLEVIAALERQRYEVVLMDVQMPEMDGIDATRWIRGRWKREPRIIALTAHALAGDRERCLRAGMDGYLAKPIQRAELEAELARVCSVVPSGVAATEPGSSPQRLAKLLAQVDDIEVASSIVDDFACEARAAEEALGRAFAAGDARTARRIAHTLGSTSALVGAHELSTLCREIERLAAAEDAAGARARMRGLGAAVEQALVAVLAERDALLADG